MTELPRYDPDRLTLQTIKNEPIRVVHDPWRQRDRVFRYTGPCLVCGRKTWSFDDGENDPRGMLGDHALWTTMAELRDGTEIELRTCSICANDYDRYQLALGLAKTINPMSSHKLGPYRHIAPGEVT